MRLKTECGDGDVGRKNISAPHDVLLQRIKNVNARYKREHAEKIFNLLFHAPGYNLGVLPQERFPPLSDSIHGRRRTLSVASRFQPSETRALLDDRVDG